MNGDYQVVRGAALNFLEQIVREKWVSASGVLGLFPAARVNGDDIEIYADESRGRAAMTWHNLRQQNVKAADRFMRIEGIGMIEKSGGKSGDWKRED